MGPLSMEGNCEWKNNKKKSNKSLKYLQGRKLETYNFGQLLKFCQSMMIEFMDKQVTVVIATFINISWNVKKFPELFTFSYSFVVKKQ